MTYVVPEGTEVPVQPAVVPVVANNVKFVIKGTGVSFYETSEAINNQDTFENFDLARAGAIQAFAKHKQDVLVALERTEKDLLVVQESSIQPVAVVANNDAAVPAPVVAAPVAGTTPVVRANSPAVQVTPIV